MNRHLNNMAENAYWLVDPFISLFTDPTRKDHEEPSAQQLQLMTKNRRMRNISQQQRARIIQMLGGDAQKVKTLIDNYVNSGNTQVNKLFDQHVKKELETMEKDTDLPQVMKVDIKKTLDNFKSIEYLNEKLAVYNMIMASYVDDKLNKFADELGVDLQKTDRAQQMIQKIKAKLRQKDPTFVQGIPTKPILQTMQKLRQAVNKYKKPARPTSEEPPATSKSSEPPIVVKPTAEPHSVSTDKWGTPAQGGGGPSGFVPKRIKLYQDLNAAVKKGKQAQEEADKKRKQAKAAAQRAKEDNERKQAQAAAQRAKEDKDPKQAQAATQRSKGAILTKVINAGKAALRNRGMVSGAGDLQRNSPHGFKGQQTKKDQTAMNILMLL